MAASLRKMGVYLGLVEDEDGYADGETYDRAPARESTASAMSGGYDAAPARAVRARAEIDHAPAPSRSWSEPDQYATDYVDYVEPDQSAAHPYRITTLHPRTYNEAVTIGEHFRTGTPVIMNLTEMADSDAKRLVDFAAGLTFGLHGRVERVTNKVFLLSPQNVTVTAADKARIAENGFFNQS
ncbi:MAG: cell division protein SepF [bacterium]